MEIKNVNITRYTKDTEVAAEIAAIIARRHRGEIRQPGEVERFGRGESAGSIGVEIERAGGRAGASLWIKMEHRWDERMYMRDEATGDDYKRTSFEVSVSWASYGSMSAAAATVRLAVMREVTETAAEIALLVESYGNIVTLIATKADREANEARRVEASARSKAQKVAEDMSKGMNAGQSKVVFTAEFATEAAFPVGEWDVKLTKTGREFTYKVAREADSAVMLTRVS